MKKLFSAFLPALLITVTLCLVLSGSATSGAASADPADTYQIKTAQNEDSGISLWFDHPTKKVLTSDTVPSGMNTYSVRMAKNEIENAQFVLFSESGRTALSAALSPFTDGHGKSLDAEIYYEMYVTTSGLDVTNVLGATSAADSVIREGETPDPIAPLSKLGTFSLTAGKSQAFLIRLKSTADTASGWYSAELDIKNSDGETVKTATVFAYVWDFELSEKTELKTAFYLANNISYGGSYTTFYNYLLENRINAMDIPGSLSRTNPYVTNDRVQAIRVTENGGGNINSYMNLWGYSNIGAYYDDLSSMPEWEQIRHKFYFYTVDEPMSQEYLDLAGTPDRYQTMDAVSETSKRVNNLWENAMTVVPFQFDTPYPYYHYDKALSNYSTSELYDAVQRAIDTESITVWCPQTFAFTPQDELSAYGYAGQEKAKILSPSWCLSGLVATKNKNGAYSYNYPSYFKWETLYGSFADRIRSDITIKKLSGAFDENVGLWTYSGGMNKGYTYCNQLIENTGLQTRLMFWQMYQNGVSGYLYYGTNNWAEYDLYNGSFADSTPTGAKTNVKWRTNKLTYPNTGYSIYGNGVLFYGPSQGRISGTNVIGTMRVEEIRDGIEDYQMLSMLEDLKGNAASQNIVSEVSKNVVNYVSLKGFDRSAFPSGMDEYDILEAVHRELGDTLEAASLDAVCEHSYGSKTVMKPASCLETGEASRTCTKCGATQTEILPALHTVGDCFTQLSITPATCTSDGSRHMKCSICGYEKSETITSFHSDPGKYVYTAKNESVHGAVCSVCGMVLDTASHVFIYKSTSTCVSAGEYLKVCKYCGYSEKISDEPPRGHNFADGVCTLCGQKEIIRAKGDIFPDGLINGKDGNLLIQICNGTREADTDEKYAADVFTDGLINGKDSNKLIQYLNGSLTTLE